jgi:bleomycin hydrolase
MLKNTLVLTLLAVSSLSATAQQTLTNKEGSQYKFTVVKDMDATAVQNQQNTGTCWSFSALSYLESELIRMGKGKQALSEMYIVRKAYEEKAAIYLRMHGMHNFGPGGAFHDIPFVVSRHGIVPESVYKGLNYGSEKHDHTELEAMIIAALGAIKEAPQKKLTPAWKGAISGMLDAYFGAVPTEFTHEGKKYTPQSYAQSLGLNMDDYVAITSYTHHPFYKPFVIEIPDNWTFGQCYNLPLDEFMDVMEKAVMNGYTFAWGADVSEDGFAFKEGLALVPKDPSTIIKTGKDNKHFSDAGADKKASCFMQPTEELWVTQEERQKAFDNFETTDDHGMHVTGIVKDQDGKKYFRVKNSWGLEHNQCDGYFYASFGYVRSKTMNIFIHKDALSKDLRKKLGL